MGRVHPGAFRQSLFAGSAAAAALLFAISTAAPALGAEGVPDSTVVAPPPPAIHPGAWALEFEIDPRYRYDLGFDSNATLSAKRFHSGRSGFRLGIGAEFGNSDADAAGSSVRYAEGYNPPYREDDVSIERINESHRYLAFLHYIRQQEVRDRVSVFAEVGPAFAYRATESQDFYVYVPYSPTDPIETDTFSSSTVQRTVSLELQLGFEWFFTKRLALGARVGLSGGYGWGTQTEDSGIRVSDGSYSRSSVTRAELERVTVQTTPATVHFSAFF